MKFRSSIFLGLFFVVGAQSQITGCAPTDDGTGSGGATSAGGSGTGGVSTGGVLNGAGGSNSGGASTNSGGAQAAGIGGTAPVSMCGTAAGGAPAQPATYDTFQQIVLATSCDSSDCHGEHADLVLRGTPDEVYDHLINTVSEECGGLKVVEPFDPDASALVRLLKGACGSLPQMPKECDCDPVPYINNCIPPDYVAGVEEWIRAGAPK
jgi:hypothetical protein